jgi:hypothetical protein
MASPNKVMPKPPAPRGRKTAAAAKRSQGHNQRPTSRAKRGNTGGFDLAQFARQVSDNYARGAAQVGREVDKALPSRGRSTSVGGAVKSGPASNAYLRMALGGK